MSLNITFLSFIIHSNVVTTFILFVTSFLFSFWSFSLFLEHFIVLISSSLFLVFYLSRYFNSISLHLNFIISCCIFPFILLFFFPCIRIGRFVCLLISQHQNLWFLNLFMSPSVLCFISHYIYLFTSTSLHFLIFLSLCLLFPVYSSSVLCPCAYYYFLISWYLYILSFVCIVCIYMYMYK